MGAPRSAEISRFGVFEFDCRSGELRKHGVRIALQEKPARILQALLAHAGEVVTRDELRSTLWKDSTFVNFDHSINIAVSKLRHALSDSGANPRFVETVSRYGYRFIAPVRFPEQPPEPSRKTMLAVMPFVNLGGNPDQMYFSDGLTEEMITQLGRLDPRRLGVIARMTAMHYKGTGSRIDEIGRELGVDYILEGSVRRSSDRVRITAQLIQVSDQTHLWAETYDSKLADVLDIQRNVTRRIARSLAVELLPAQQAMLARAGPRNTAAHEAYLKGRYFWSRRTEDSFAKALRYFEQAIREDPRCALAYAGLAESYDTLGLFSAVPAHIARQKSKEAATHALELDPTLAEAHTALAYSKALFDWDWSGAEREFCSALELNANYVIAHQWYGHLLAMMGRFGESLARMDAALSLDPLSLVAGSHKGWILYFAHRFEEAGGLLRRTLDMDPTFGLGIYFLGLTYLRMNRPDEAIRTFEEAYRVSPDHPSVLSGLGQAYALQGRIPEARRYLDALDAQARTRHVTPYFPACVHSALGDTDRALALLEDAFTSRCPWMSYLNVDPAVDSLRLKPRFREMVGRIFS
jgi:TolB-like protein/Tfp pilus assembly protein PilF